MVFSMDMDPKKDWKFIALIALIVCALTLWGTDSNNPHVLAYAVDTSLITITLYYTIEMDDILLEFSNLTGAALCKAIGLRLLVLVAVTVILAMIHGYRMITLLEHVLLLRGQIGVDNRLAKSEPVQQASSSTTSNSSKSSKAISSAPKASVAKKMVHIVEPDDDETESDWDDKDGEEEEDEEAVPSDAHQSAKSLNSQFLERPSSRISGSTANSASLTSKPSPATDGVPTKSSK